MVVYQHHRRVHLRSEECAISAEVVFNQILTLENVVLASFYHSFSEPWCDGVSHHMIVETLMIERYHGQIQYLNE